ncbi:MAG: RNA polymerase sigma factor [Luteibaculum sp.]
MVAAEYNQCVDAYSDRLYRFVLKVGASRQVANELVKNCFTSLWQQKENIGTKEVRIFLFSAAFHALHKLAKTDPDKLRPEEEVIYASQGIQRTLSEGLYTLHPVHRALLVLRDYEGSSYGELALISGLEETKVKSEIYIARKKLKRILIQSQLKA